VRIVGVLDAVQPCSKGPGGGGVFPGLLGPALPVGRGETHVLRGAAVLAAGYLPRAQEAIIDMSGPAAPLSPLGATRNLVVEFTPAEDAAWEDVDAALRRGLVRVAAHLEGLAGGSGEIHNRGRVKACTRREDRGNELPDGQSCGSVKAPCGVARSPPATR